VQLPESSALRSWFFLAFEFPSDGTVPSHLVVDDGPYPDGGAGYAGLVFFFEPQPLSSMVFLSVRLSDED